MPLTPNTYTARLEELSKYLANKPYYDSVHGVVLQSQPPDNEFASARQGYAAVAGAYKGGRRPNIASTMLKRLGGAAFETATGIDIMFDKGPLVAARARWKAAPSFGKYVRSFGGKTLAGKALQGGFMYAGASYQVEQIGGIRKAAREGDFEGSVEATANWASMAAVQAGLKLAGASIGLSLAVGIGGVVAVEGYRNYEKQRAKETYLNMMASIRNQSRGRQLLNDRQRSVAEMSMSPYNPRFVLGREAELLHQR